MIRHRLFTFIFALSAGLSASAAEVISFSQSIELLKQNNGELRAAELNLEAARFNQKSLYGGFLPQVSGSINYSRTQQDGVDGEGYGAGLNISQNLFNGFGDVARMDKVKAELTAAEASLRSVKAKLSYELKSSYANLAYAYDSIKLADSILKRRADNLNLVELRFQTGRENKGSVLLSKANLRQAQLDVLKANNALETAKSSFARVLGSPHLNFYEIKDRVPELSVPSSAPDFNEIVLSVPSRVVSESRVKGAEASVTESRSSFYPTLKLEGNVGSSGANYFPEDSEGWSVGVVLSWSLFNGGRDYFVAKSTFASKLVAENTLRNLDLDLRTQLRGDYAGFIEAIEDLNVRQDFAEALNTRAEIGRGKYNNGLITFDDWDVIENDLIARQKELTAKRRDKVVAEAAWEQAQGVGVLP